ncbi:hypothetical protein TWF106_008143 [Orbilia oligospora]|uniref:Uncharacterized protein n=1 Tax=Orbilia oligospora TaxID=2813651 RepID=A0A6G1MKT6_ORBOL|nr:hypothetical protein TWF788_010785 [Orbilia oligospora]KAF3205810.1 hypothetical protein TWF679_009180 [Orbilia oligospora]KAF3216742.1 hypothetical protein TWF106_008143 [Orbilia oligospora]KAF3259699.1 hypothetical protein TWF192_010554 [Orbilia oligospora]
MEHYNSAQGQGGYGGQRQPRMYSSGSSNDQQYYQGEYDHQYALQQQKDKRSQRASRQQANYDHQYASQQQDDYDYEYAPQQQDDYGYQNASQQQYVDYGYQQAYGSQQGFQAASSTEAAGPSSHVADHQQSRRHKKPKARRDAVRMKSERMWECCQCGSAWNIEIHEACLTPECRGHIRCPNCIWITNRVPADA